MIPVTEILRLWSNRGPRVSSTLLKNDLLPSSLSPGILQELHTFAMVCVDEVEDENEDS